MPGRALTIVRIKAPGWQKNYFPLPMAEETRELLVATRNKGKVAEIESLLAGLPARLRSLDDFPCAGEVEETGGTFEENAALKAGEYARRTGLLSLADDSGLEVDALGGRPGV